MRTVRTIAELRAALAPARGGRIGFVPTMGALHEGHLSLLRAAREDNDTVVLSIFVNPTQFDQAADLAAYPRTEERDAELAASAGVDVLFAPDAAELYPAGFATTVRVAGSIVETLEGAHRGRAHFDGVATVVARLLGLVLPDVAFFGQKDAQQCAVVMRLVKDLGLPVEVRVAPTVRESDGLALSSRNAYLTAEERKAAPTLFRALLATQLVHELGEKKAEKLLKAFRLAISTEPLLVLDSVDLVDVATMKPVAKVDRPVLLAAAVKVGRTRLIDNVVFGG